MSLAGKLDCRRGLKRLVTKGCQFVHDNRKKKCNFYVNGRSIRIKFVKIKAYVNLENLIRFL